MKKIPLGLSKGHLKNDEGFFRVMDYHCIFDEMGTIMKATKT